MSSYPEGWHDDCVHVSWATSEARERLNGTYLNSFNAEDRARIVPTNIDGGVDYIFLLSKSEVERYFRGNFQLIPGFTRTPSADGIWVYGVINHPHRGGFIMAQEAVNGMSNGVVRPAMWIMV